jgi:membrane protease YdiL (CAAX protease family)
VLRLTAGFYAAMFLGGIVGLGYREALPDSLNNQLIAFALGAFIYQGVTLVLVHIFLKQHESSWVNAFGFNEPRLGRAIFLGALVSILVLPVALSLAGLTERLIREIGYTPEMQQPVKMVMQATSVQQLIVHGVAAVIFAPIVEEIIFRGVLYPAVKRQAGQRLALWGVSLLFALTHMNLTALLALTVLGIILTFLYEETGNLITPIIAHSVFNAVNFAYMVFQRYSEGAL